jgi:hypothetical protein
MMRMRPVPVGRHLAADAPVVEGECAKMLGQQDNRIALALIRTERPRGHHPIALEAQRQAIVIQLRHELAVTDRHPAEPQVSHDVMHVRAPSIARPVG